MKKALALLVILSLLLSSCMMPAPSGDSSSASSSKSTAEVSAAEVSVAEISAAESSITESAAESDEESIEESVAAESIAPEESSQVEESSQSTPSTETAAKEFTLGTVTDGSYENTFLEIGVNPGDSWIFTSVEGLADYSGVSVDQMTDEGAKDLLANKQIVFGMFAQENSGLATMNIVFEYLGALYGATLDESGYIDIALPQLAPSLESQGFKNITATKGVHEFAGVEHGTIKITAQMTINNSDVDIYELLVVIKQGDYVASVTLASFVTDTTEELAAMYYEVK